LFILDKYQANNNRLIKEGALMVTQDAVSGQAYLQAEYRYNSMDQRTR